jgi:hypothetical protein
MGCAAMKPAIRGGGVETKDAQTAIRRKLIFC